MDVYCSIVCEGKKLETEWMSMNMEMIDTLGTAIQRNIM